MNEIIIGNKKIAAEFPARPFLIAEAGVNHGGSMERAKQMIEEAAEAGVDAIKFQSYKAEKLASRYSPAYWDLTKESTRSQYELFKKYDVFWKDEYEQLAKFCEQKKIIFLSTPFDFESVDFLDELMPAFKIASADITNLPLLRHIARKGKPLLLSTGAATVWEIWKAIDAINSEGNDMIILLHCVLNYPTPYTRANLGMIMDMKKKFPHYILGYSDHTLPDKLTEVLTVAWLLGAQVLEKHFTYDKSLPGNDHYHSMDISDIKKFRENVDFLISLIGSTKKHYIPEEEISRLNARRSLVAAKDIKAGSIMNRECIDIKRPGHGLPPEILEKVVGSIALRDLAKDEIINYGDFVSREMNK